MAIRRDIQFIPSRDGTKIAMARSGSGPAVIKAATWLTHMEWAPPGMAGQALIDEFSEGHTYIEYDTRGCGLSQRRVDDISFEAWMDDLEAVADASGQERFVLMGFTCAAGVAVEYAARHPERVSQLILFGGFATSYHSTSHPDPAIRREGDLMLELAAVGWGNSSPSFRQVFVSRFLPEATPAEWSVFDQLQRETTAPEVAVRYLRAMYSMDVKQSATQVRCPTLVMHCKGDQMVRYEQGMRLASLIPGARFIALDGSNHIPLARDVAWGQFVEEVRAFLGRSPEGQLDAPAVSPRLTARQQQVLQLVARGQTDKQVAKALELSPRTVEMHVAGALKALGCKTRIEAVQIATRQRLLR